MGNRLEQTLAELLLPYLEQTKARQFGIDAGYKHDASTTPISSGYTHGPGGLLTFPGVDPVAFNAAVGAYSILGQLPTNASLYTDPTFWTLTGVLAESGSEPDGVCDDPPVAGLMKGCLRTAPFGRYERSTPVLELNRMGQRNDRADPMDIRLVGSPIAGSSLFSAGNFDPTNPVDVFSNEVSRKFMERNISFHRLLAKQLWQGAPVNNSAGGGYKEITGLDTLVAGGYVDAETGVACPAMDSYVKDFGHASVSANGGNLVAALTDMWWQVKRRAERSGVMPVRWVLAMKPQMFYEITSIWPCAYLSYRCNLGGTSATEFIDAQDAVRIRDEMRAGNYLLMDGMRVEVVLDDGIDELDGNNGGGNFPKGCFESDIYLIPMSVIGGQAVTYLDYFQYANPSIQDALGNMILGKIEGAFLTWPKQQNLCIQWASKVEPRLVLRTPWLAARLNNVVYCPIQHEREPFPEDPYFVNGGRTSRTGPSFFSHWQS